MLLTPLNVIPPPEADADPPELAIDVGVIKSSPAPFTVEPLKSIVPVVPDVPERRTAKLAAFTLLIAITLSPYQTH
jgi:hypothetical protein